MKTNPLASNFFRLATALLLFTAPAPLWADEEEDAKTEKDAELEAKKAAETEELRAQFPYSFDDVAGNLVLITCSSPFGDSAGSGFIAKMEGKTYIFTNQHVIMGATRISLQTVDGEDLKPKKIELSAKRDIARLLISDRENAFEITGEINSKMPIAVFGNSEGAGVATELYGTVNGYGANLAEVTAEFVSGNSGSPVLNTNRQVIGIASYVRYSRPNRTTENTRFEDAVRRFCFRLDNVRFGEVKWGYYNKEYGLPYQEDLADVEELFSVIEALFDDPTGGIPEKQTASELRSWAVQHNRSVSHSGNIRKDVGNSAQSLASICERKARNAEMKLKKRDLTEFLREEYEGIVYSYKYAADLLDLLAVKLGQ